MLDNLLGLMMQGRGNGMMQGRGNDTDFRLVKGELAHVNPMEANIIDEHGGAGEQVVSEMGSGTINPYTGLREYYDWSSIGWESDDAFWQPVSGKWGVFGQTDAAKEADEEANKKERISRRFDKNIGAFEQMNFAEMTSEERRDAVGNLMGEADMDQMSRYFTEYDPTEEKEAATASTREMQKIGAQTNVSLLDLFQQQSASQSRSGFASTGNPMVDRQRQDIFSASRESTKDQWTSLQTQRRGIQDDYNFGMIEDAFKFEEGLTS